MSENIFDKIGHDSGMTVPEGYFDDFKRQMAASLPEQPWEKPAEDAPVAPRSLWLTLRPYVYMAAMFAGIWLMMSMFDHIRPSSTDMTIDNNPVLTAALENDAFVNEYFIDDMDDEQVYDDMWTSGVTPNDFSPNDL